MSRSIGLCCRLPFVLFGAKRRTVAGLCLTCTFCWSCMLYMNSFISVRTFRVSDQAAEDGYVPRYHQNHENRLVRALSSSSQAGHTLLLYRYPNPILCDCGLCPYQPNWFEPGYKLFWSLWTAAAGSMQTREFQANFTREAPIHSFGKRNSPIYQLTLQYISAR